MLLIWIFLRLKLFSYYGMDARSRVIAKLLPPCCCINRMGLYAEWSVRRKEMLWYHICTTSLNKKNNYEAEYIPGADLAIYK